MDEKRAQLFCKVLPEHLERWDAPPVHLYESAVKVRIEQSQDERFRHAAVRGDRLTAVWNAYRNQPELPYVKVILAEGFPLMKGLQVDFETNDLQSVYLTLPESPITLRSWHPA